MRGHSDINTTYFIEVEVEWCLDKSVGQTESDLERGFGKQSG